MEKHTLSLRLAAIWGISLVLVAFIYGTLALLLSGGLWLLRTLGPAETWLLLSFVVCVWGLAQTSWPARCLAWLTRGRLDTF